MHYYSTVTCLLGPGNLLKGEKLMHNIDHSISEIAVFSELYCRLATESTILLLWLYHVVLRTTCGEFINFALVVLSRPVIDFSPFQKLLNTAI